LTTERIKLIPARQAGYQATGGAGNQLSDSTWNISRLHRISFCGKQPLRRQISSIDW
jgi:hypothetical protein